MEELFFKILFEMINCNLSFNLIFMMFLFVVIFIFFIVGKYFGSDSGKYVVYWRDGYLIMFMF